MFTSADSMVANKTVVIACRLYEASADKFKELCRRLDEFHSDVMRKLILEWTHEHEKNGVTLNEDID